MGAGHIVLDGFPALRERGTTSPLLGPCLLWPRSPILATAELLFILFDSLQQLCLAGARQRRVTRRRHSTSPAASVALEAASDVPESERTEVRDGDDNVASRKTKKIKVVTNLTEEEEQIMVEWLEANPIILNKKLQPYKDSARIDRQWEKKVTEVGKSVVVLKTWYTSLHSRHGMGV